MLWRNLFINFQQYDYADHFTKDSDENEYGEEDNDFKALAIEGTERWRDRGNFVF